MPIASLKSLLLLASATVAIVSGCSRAPMQPSELHEGVDADKALVNFVRTSIFFGDGVNFTIWDGRKIVGTLNAGHIIQYETEPGEHIFMCRTESWTYMKAVLKPGHEYFVKPFSYPGLWVARFGLRPENANVSKRIDGWLKKLSPEALDAEAATEYLQSTMPLVEEAIEEYENGEVTYTELPADFGRPWTK